MFKINCLLPTHDENDILEDCIESALSWSDNIYVYDTAGQEETRELVKRVSSNYPNVHLYKSEFHSATKWLELSHDMFAKLYSNSEVGDWWCFLYTDERYPEDPRLFLSKIPQSYNCVFSTHLNYYFTEEDLKLLVDECGEGAVRSNKNLIPSLRFYKNSYSEARFFRHNKLTTNDSYFSPSQFNDIFSQRIIVKHFQYRSPAQIIRRVRSRQNTFRNHPNRDFVHEMDFRFDADGFQVADLQTALKNTDKEFTDFEILSSRAIPSNILDFDDLSNKFVFHEEKLEVIPQRFSVILRELFRQLLLRFKQLKRRFRIFFLLHFRKKIFNFFVFCR